MRLKLHFQAALPLGVLCLLSFNWVGGLAQPAAIQTNRWAAMSDEQLLQSAQSGNAQAQYQYWVREMNDAFESRNRVYREQGVPRGDLTQADIASLKTKWDDIPESDMRQAAKTGNYGAQIYLCNLAERQAAQRGLAAFEWAKRSADQGFPDAEYDVACAYLLQLNWNFVPINQPEGLKFLQRAADHGLSTAQYLLATFYLAGQFLPADYPKAIHYLQEAADQNGPRSQYHLALLYSNGNGEPRSEADSPLALLRKSAKSGFRPAAYALAERYRTGLGVPIDYVQSIRFYQAAWNPADRYSEDSQPNAGEVFKLVDQNLDPMMSLPFDFRNFARALSLYLKATKKEDPGAMGQIGDWYLNGRFEPKDLVEAWRWLTLAADHGAPGAAAKKDSFKDKLTPEQWQQIK